MNSFHFSWVLGDSHQGREELRSTIDDGFQPKPASSGSVKVLPQAAGMLAELQVENSRLRRLLGELLVKNQQLREALQATGGGEALSA